MSAALILERLNNSGRLWSMRAGDAGAETSGIFLLLNHSSPRLTVSSVAAARLFDAPPPPQLTHVDTFMFSESDAPPSPRCQFKLKLSLLGGAPASPAQHLGCRGGG